MWHNMYDQLVGDLLACVLVWLVSSTAKKHRWQQGTHLFVSYRDLDRWFPAMAKALLYGDFLHAWGCDYYICISHTEEHCRLFVLQGLSCDMCIDWFLCVPILLYMVLVTFLCVHLICLVSLVPCQVCECEYCAPTVRGCWLLSSAWLEA